MIWLCLYVCVIGLFCCLQLTNSLQITNKLPIKLQNIVNTFQLAPSNQLKHQQILYLGSKLPSFPNEYKLPQNKVPGCLSTVYIHSYLTNDGKIMYQGDADSHLTKGLAAILIDGLSGIEPQEIEHLSADFITEAGIGQSLTPGRNNGFLNMFNLMKKQAKLLSSTSPSSSSSIDSMKNVMNEEKNKETLLLSSENPPLNPSLSSGNPSISIEIPSQRPTETIETIETRIRNKLQSELQPLSMNLINESEQHQGHINHQTNNLLPNESHFSLTIVSSRFIHLTLLQRHQLIYRILAQEISEIHALSIVAKTPEER